MQNTPTRTSARLGTWRVTRRLTRKLHDCPHTNWARRTSWGCEARQPAGGGPRVVVSTAAFHARVRGSVPGLGGLKDVSPPSTCKTQYCGEPTWPRGSVLGLGPPGPEFRILCLAQFCLYVVKGGLKPDSFHCDNWRDENVTVLKMPIALAYVVALVRFGNDQIMCLKTDATSFKADNHVTNSSYIEMIVCMCDTVNDGKISHYKLM